MSLSVNNNNYMSSQNSFLLSKTPPTDYLEDGTSQLINDNQINHNNNGRDKTLQEIWSMHNFADEKVKVEKLQQSFTMKMTWANCFSNNNNNNNNNNDVEELQQQDDKIEVDDSPLNVNESSPNNLNSTNNECTMQELNDMTSPTSPPPAVTSPSHHARRPMNAFLIFCKKHRPIVREIYPKLENRGVTKILGEWWEFLDDEDKQPYRDLAKEYKDAFFCAYPNFRWYKLPAPPLRSTCPSRPNSLPISNTGYMTNQFKESLANLPTHKFFTTVPQSSPSNNNNNNNNTNNYNTFSEFTPGKLADESQLGGLTSLMTNNFLPKPKIVNNNCCDTSSHDNKTSDSNDKDEAPDSGNSKNDSPVNLLSLPNLPPKPIKKRKLENDFEPENKEMSDLKIRKILDLDGDCCKESKEELANESTSKVEKVDVKERKSDRQCKGKRYEKFMFEGKLLGNKKDAKLTQQKVSHHSLETDVDNNKSDTPKLDLSNTIKRLIERTKPQHTTNSQNGIDNRLEENTSNYLDGESAANNNHNQRNEFNLDLKISNLPSLSYELFSQRKRECKKRKFRSKTDMESNQLQKIGRGSGKQLVGSKKRKNKESITHLSNENSNSDGGTASTTHNPNVDLLGLATLAEIAAQTEKISE